MNISKEEYVKRRHPRQIYQDSQKRWCTYITDKNTNRRKLIARLSYDALIEALYNRYKVEEYEKDISKVTLSKLYSEWIDHKRLHGVAGSTILRYETDWKRFYQNSAIVNKPISALTKKELDDWLHLIVLENHMTRKQYVNVASIIKQEIDYAMELGIVEQNNARLVKIESRMFKSVKKKPSESQVYSDNEILSIKEYAWSDIENPRLVYKSVPLAIIFMFNTGMRVGEVCVLKYDDIDGNYIHVDKMLVRDEVEIKDDTKGMFGDRWVPLTEEAKTVISKSITLHRDLGLEKCEYIFSSDGSYLPHRAVNDRLRVYCRKLGITFRSSHKIRKTYISTLIDGGVNINTIREIVGHKDERTTLNCYCYDRLSLDERREKIEKALNPTK